MIIVQPRKTIGPGRQKVIGVAPGHPHVQYLNCAAYADVTSLDQLQGAAHVFGIKARGFSRAGHRSVVVVSCENHPSNVVVHISRRRTCLAAAKLVDSFGLEPNLLGPFSPRYFI